MEATTRLQQVASAYLCTAFIAIATVKDYLPKPSQVTVAENKSIGRFVFRGLQLTTHSAVQKRICTKTAMW